MWFTKNDVSRAADVFLTWFGRVAPTPGTYSNEVLVILQGQKDNFVNIISKMLNLQVEDAKVDGVFSAPAPATFEEMQAVMPGLKAEDVQSLSDAQCRALIAVARCCK